MRILHTADWHLGRTLEGRSRLAEQVDFLDELVTIIRDEKIDIVLLAGDVYDTVNPPAAAEQLFYDAIARITDGGKVPVVAIAGNHDSPDRLTASNPLTTKQGLTIVGLPTTEMQQIVIPRTDEIATIYALPYPSESRLNQCLTSETDEDKLQQAYAQRIAQLLKQQSSHFQSHCVNLIMSHLYVFGGKETDSERPIQVGGAYTVPASVFDVGAQYTALGHLHRPQCIKPTVRYSGSPLAYSFSESGQTKSVTIIDASPGQEVTQKEIWLTSGKPLVKWRAKKGVSEVYPWLLEKRDANAWIDLELEVDQFLTNEEIAKIRKHHEGIIHIRPILTQEEEELSSTYRMQMPIDQLFKQFYKKQTGGAEPDEETIKLFLQLASLDETDQSRKEKAE
ncbi:metallophosphoesterase family protein [Longirhabdus pacifica]|uniref:metallophosphoesterase family protein n=1 Tax=Longirhabdus pacifica TaxID=2305227 RepID=UPI00100916D0|nr:exonuclease SbcCD subunit D C-terminal domain-containing protein [Longirhabdus pacifica]